MDHLKKGRKTEKLLIALSVTLLLGFFAVFALINFGCFARFCEQDMYADTLAAKLMWEQKSFFPFGFVFGNQLYIIATPAVAALFYGLTGSPNTAMALATTLMSLFIMLSFAWMLKPFLKSKLSLAAAMLLLAACAFGNKLVNQEEGQLLFLMCSYYACYVITLFVVLGDYVRSFKDSRRRLPPLALALLLCFATGMQSIRQTCIMVLPILAFEGLGLLLEFKRQGRGALAARRGSLSRALGYAAANLAGLLFIRLFDVHQYTIFSSAGAGLGQRLGDIYRACRGISGFAWTGPEYPFFTLMFVFQAALLALALYLQLRHIKKGGELSALWWLLLISIGAVIAAALLTSLKIRSVYLFCYYPLLALSAALALERLPQRRGFMLALGLCLLAGLNLYYSYVPSLREGLEEREEPARQISQWAVENGYELVYGGHSFVAPAIAAHSDGRLTAGCWNDEIMFKAKEYLNLQNIYSLEDVQRAIFVFMPYELDYAREAAMNAGAELEFHGQYGEMLVYTSTVQLMYPRTYPWFDQLWYAED